VPALDSPSIRRDALRLAAARTHLEAGRGDELRTELSRPVQVRRAARGEPAEYVRSHPQDLSDKLLGQLRTATRMIERNGVGDLLTLVDFVSDDARPYAQRLVRLAPLAQLDEDIRRLRDAADALGERQHEQQVRRWHLGNCMGPRPQLRVLALEGLRELHDHAPTWSGDARRPSLGHTLATQQRSLQAWAESFRAPVFDSLKPREDLASTLAALATFIDLAARRSGELRCEVHPAHVDAVRTRLALCLAPGSLRATMLVRGRERIPAAEISLQIQGGAHVTIWAELGPASRLRSASRLADAFASAARRWGIGDITLGEALQPLASAAEVRAQSASEHLGVRCLHQDTYVHAQHATHRFIGCRTCQHTQVRMEALDQDDQGSVLAMARQLLSKAARRRLLTDQPALLASNDA
jgi:hypothetical protein